MSDREPMRPVDHAWLRMDRPDNRMIITGIMALDRPLDWERFVRTVEERFRPYLRFRQRVDRSGGAAWTAVPDHDVRRHLHRVRLDAPADRAELERFVSARLQEPLDPDRPLWRMDYVENFKSGSAIVARIHHCIGDGMSLLQVLMNLADAEAGRAAAPVALPLRDAAPGAAAAVRRGLGSLLELAVMRPDPPTAFRGALGVEKRVAWSPRIPLEGVKAIRSRLGGTVNDVLVAAVAGGLRDRLESRESGSSRPIRAVLPVNLRGSDELEELGNRFGLVFLALPLDLDDDRERLAAVRARMDRLKRSPQPWVVYGLLRLFGRLGSDLQGAALRKLARNATGVLTNVPGPRDRMEFCGAAIEDFMFWVPQSGDLGLGISILSYAGHVRIGVAADRGLEPEPAAVIEATRSRLRAMEREAGLTPDRGGSTSAPAPGP